MRSNNQYKTGTMYNKSFLSILVLSLIIFSFNCVWADSGNSISIYIDTVQKIYIGYYQRPADPIGLIYWANRLDATGGNLTEIIEAFAHSAESQALYGTINSSNISTVVNGIYNALFDRDAEVGGLSYYVNGFNSGQFTAATIMLNVLYGAKNEDLQSVNNKLATANLFTRTINPELDGKDFQYSYSGNADAERARDFLSAVTWESATIPTVDEIRAFFVPEASATVGPAGGIVEVTNPSSPLFGVKVEIPAGALDTNTNITISIHQSIEPTFPTSLKKVNAIVSLAPAGIYFNTPVTISIPYNSNNVSDKNMLGVYTYDRTTLSWNMLTLMDMSSEVIKVLTQHFSLFQVAEYTEPLSNEGDTGFRPSINGFAIDNFVDDSDPGGHCWGMVAFAAWYWEYKQSDVSLSVKYPECKAKNVIKETHHILKGYINNFIDFSHQDAAYVANAIMMGIDLGKPQLLALYNSSYFGSGHAVLVYGYKKNSDSLFIFSIYDPNYPADDNKQIIYKSGGFEPYGNYDVYRYLGGLFSLSSYESIYNLEMMPEIKNISPTGTISSKRPTISATIESSSPYNRNIDTSKIEMKLDGNLVSHTISGSGSVITVSYTPSNDLSNGNHTVSMSGSDIEEIETCSISWTFSIMEECVNIAGNWSGTATYWGEDLRIFFYLSQNECNVSGIFQSPDSCPSQCGYPLNGNITGRVSGNIFTFTILNDPLVDCETCEFICAGTDQGSLTIDGSRMYGTAKSEDCEVGTFDDVWVNVTRSSGVSSVNKLEKKKGIGKSSLLSPKGYNK